MLSLVFELKQNFEAQPWNEPVTTKKGWNYYGALWEKYNYFSLYPTETGKNT